MLENRPRRSRATRKLADDEEEQLKKVLALSKAEYEQTHSLPNSSNKRGLLNDNNNEPLTKKIKLKESLAPQKTNKMLAMSKQNKKDAITYSKKDNFTASSSKKSSKSQLKSSSSSASQHRYFNRARTNAAPERSVLAGSTKANINLLDWCKEKSNEVIKDYAYYKICEESNEVKSDFGMVHLNVRDSKYTYLPGLEEISASYSQLSEAVDENDDKENDKEENSENSRETEETEEIGDNNVTLQTILSNRPPALKILDNFQSSIAQTTNTLVLSHLVGTSADRMNKITEYKKLICDCQTLDKEHKIQAAVNKKLKKILTELNIEF